MGGQGQEQNSLEKITTNLANELTNIAYIFRKEIRLWEKPPNYIKINQLTNFDKIIRKMKKESTSFWNFAKNSSHVAKSQYEAAVNIAKLSLCWKIFAEG